VQITGIEPILYDAGLRRVWCFVRITTDEGIVGYGEATTTEPFMAGAVVRRLAEWLIGEDPRRISDLWQRMYRRYYNVRGGNLLLAAMSGIEHALWDIKGKAAGLPVYELLGGAIRNRVPVYANHMFFPSAADPDAPALYAERAAEAVARGYRAVKIEPFGRSQDTLSRAELRHVCAVVRAVREAVGPDVEIGIDSHARFGVGPAIQAARALEEFEPFFFEEPVPPENVAAMRKVREAVTVPIATGERLYTKWGFRELLEAQAAEIIQVDVAHCGGILEARLIAALAETYYVQVAPHSWYGPVSLAASLHLDACIPNFLIQETPVPHEMPAQQRDLVLTPLQMESGTMAIPAGPGLGITLDEALLDRHRLPG
jgi:galactonate dehydratase